MNAYIQFYQTKFKDVAQANKNLKAKEVTKTLGDMWKALSFEEKQLYYKKAAENSQAYKDKVNDIKGNLSMDQLLKLDADVKEERAARLKKLKRFREKKERRLLKEPKRPVNAFSLYLETLDRGEASATEFIKGAASKWRQIAEDDKKPFRDAHKKALEKYQIDKNSWDVQMIKEGKAQLARKAFRKIIEKNLKAKNQLPAKTKTKSKRVKSKIAKSKTSESAIEKEKLKP